MRRSYHTVTVLLVVLLLVGTGSTITAFSLPRTAAAAPATPAWTIQYQAPEGITLRGLKMLNTQVGYAVGGPDWGGQGNPYILKTTNGGTNWTRLDLPAFVNGWQGGIDCLSELHCLSVGTTGQAIRTTDGGTTWANSGMANGYGGYLYTAHWANSTTVLAGGTNGHSFRSTNGGVTWTEFLPGGYVVIWEFQCFGATCYGAGNGASFAYSFNTGASWSRRFAPQFDLLGLSFLNTNTGWVSAAHGEIYFTTDAGQSWVSRTSGINPNEKYNTNFYDIEMLNAQEGWVVGGLNDVSGRIYRTTNGGVAWAVQAIPATGFVWEVDFVDATHGWAVTHDGKILAYGEPQGPTPTPTPTSTATPTPTPTASPTATPTAQPGTGHLAGTVFHDRNGNGQREGDEPGLPGATVDVRLGGGTPVTVVVSGSDGAYAARNLTPQTYEVEVTPPAGFIALSGTNPALVPVTVGQTSLRDFPMIVPPPTPTPTVTPTPNVSSVQRQVAGGLDDTHQRVSTGYNDIGALTVRTGLASGHQLLSGFRFANVQIPSHVRVIDANLEVNRTYHAGSDAVNMTLRAAAQDSVPNFQTQPPLTVPTTQASVTWVISSTVPTGWLASPDLAGLVQEVVDRPGWQPGNALAVLLASDSSNTGYMDAISYDANPLNAARLQVDYAVCLAADVDCSCDVSVGDVQLVAARWGLTSSSPQWHPVYDLVPNGVIDAADITAAASGWGQWGC